ncbi:MAG: hypothetical protein DHS20C04_01090 [Hyphococcus sp.]|nr:MAG: hypothetical protein DHS20C04_01090 [Marinicaulis sp.]
MREQGIWGMKKLLIAMVMAGAAWSAASNAVRAQTLGSLTGDQLEDILSAADLSPSMMADSATGAPVATGKAGQFDFYVRALSCSGSPSACETLVFFANFELGRTVTANDYRLVNSFNDSQVFGRAYVLEGTSEVGVDYVIELNGGVTENHLSQNISRWADVISAFVSKFQEGAPTS